MLEDIFKGLSSAAGIETVEDFGSVYEKEINNNVATIKLSIERYNAYYFVRIAVSYRRGMSGKTRVIKWPYSKTDAKDLSIVIEDITKITQAKDHPELDLRDNRTGIGRWFDSLTGRKYYGHFDFSSPKKITDDVNVSAEIADSGKDTLVSLTERKKGHGFILAHPQHDSFKHILDTLKNYIKNE